ncbi:MAG: TrkH family potassium uptake protein [Methanocella sp.]
MERSGNRVVPYRHIRIILSNLTGLFAVTAILMGAMTVICFLLGEAYASPGFAVSFVVSGVAAVVLKIVFPSPEELELRHAMLVAALAYLAVPAISTIPFVMIEHMSVIDAFFESISGWSCTGLTMIVYPEYCTHVIQLFRSLTQWIGGIGVILLMVTILIRPGTSTYIMYQSETRKEKIKPSIRSTINMIWFLYLVITLLGVALLVVVGMPLWDSINHSMVSIGTGGFSVWSDSIAHYQSFNIELACMVIMIIGALPIVFIYKSIKTPKSLFNLDSEVKAYFFIILLGVTLLTAEYYIEHGNLFESLRISAFQFVSGLTTTGLQTTDMSTGWSHTALLILSIAAIIGGCAGSTSGGLKVSRVVFLIKEFELWLKRTLLPRNAIVTLKIGNKRLAEDVVRKELSEAALISFLYLVVILVSVMLLSHFVASTYDLSTIIFSVCSAQGNVGLQTPIINPALHYIGKIILIVDMWVGRLEIIPVTLLIRYMIKGFKV